MNEAKQTLQAAQNKINELWPKPGDGGGEQQGGGDSGGQPKNPKVGESWETEKGGIIVLIVSANGQGFTDKGTESGYWMANGAVGVEGGNTERNFGALVRKVSDAPEEKPESGEAESGQEQNADDSKPEKGVKKARKAKKNEVVMGAGSPGAGGAPDETPTLLFEGCYGTARNGEVIGPFTHKSPISKWPWEAYRGGELISWMPDGTYYERERKEDLDIVQIHKTRPE